MYRQVVSSYELLNIFEVEVKYVHPTNNPWSQSLASWISHPNIHSWSCATWQDMICSHPCKYVPQARQLHDCACSSHARPASLTETIISYVPRKTADEHTPRVTDSHSFWSRHGRAWAALLSRGIYRECGKRS